MRSHLSVIRNITLGLALALGAALSPTSALAVRPSDQLLPDTTRGYFSVVDAEALETSWNQTQIGQLMDDPVMEPFSEDLKQQLRNRFTRVRERLGLTLDDLEGVPGGELALAVVQPAPDDAALALLVDVTDHLPQAQALLAKIDANLIQRRAVKATHELAGVQVTAYTLPKREGEAAARQVVFFLHENLLCGTDSLNVTTGILQRAQVEPAAEDALSQQQAYSQVMSRCAQDAGELVPHIRWYIDPFGYSEAVRILKQRQGEVAEDNLIEKIANLGFSAVQGAGGHVSFYVNDGQYEMLHRTLVYAPPVPGQEEEHKYASSARMLTFPNSESLAPHEWIPREIAAYLSFNWKVQQAFDNLDPLADEVIGVEDGWQQALEGIQYDELGPKISIRDELVAYLGDRSTLITDYQLPITPKSERRLLAIESINATTLTQSIEKLMRADPKARRREFGQNVVWEIVQEEEDLPQVRVEVFDPAAAGSREDDEQDEPKRKLPNAAVCVAHGHLLVASHFDFMTKVLEEVEARKTLARSPDYQIVSAELDKLMPGEHSFRSFSRTDEEYRPTYELIRVGRMPESESLLGRALNALFGEGDEESLREQKIDGSSLPDFDTVRRYFGPAGLTVRTEDNGWYIVGFSLNKQSP